SKDWGLLHEAMRLLDPMLRARTTLFVVGDKGSDIACSNINIRFLGTVTDPSIMANWYGLADIYVHASRAETFCLAILEAMASACTVVATDVGGVQEQLGSHRASNPRGVIVPPGDPRALSCAIASIVNNAEMRADLASAAADYVSREWSLTRH